MLDMEFIHNFVERFLSNLYPSQKHRDYNLYYGELVSACIWASYSHKPELGASLNTYLFERCRWRVAQLNKKEKMWYGQHSTGFSLDDIKNSEPAYTVAEHNECIEIVKKSELTEKHKDIVIIYISRPFCTFQEIADHLGISKQYVNRVILSAKQFFERRKISI